MQNIMIFKGIAQLNKIKTSNDDHFAIAQSLTNHLAVGIISAMI